MTSLPQPDEEVQPERGLRLAARAGQEVGREVPAHAAQEEQERLQAQPGRGDSVLWAIMVQGGAEMMKSSCCERTLIFWSKIVKMWSSEKFTK